MNDQRKVIYEQRRELMEADDVSETIADMRNEQLRFLLARHIQYGSSPKEWAVEELKQDLARMSGAILPIEEWAAEPEMDYEKLEEKVLDAIEQRVREKNDNVPAEIVRLVENQSFCRNWMPFGKTTLPLWTICVTRLFCVHMVKRTR